MKKCTSCQEEKAHSEFYKFKKGRLGLAAHCKECHKEKGREVRRRHASSGVVTPPPEKKCPSCEETKPRSEFRTDRTRADHLTSACSACISQRSRDYYQRNKDRIRANVKAYQKAKPEVQARAVAKRRENGKARAAHIKYVYGLSPEEYRALVDRAGGLCEICGRVPSEASSKGVCVDHCHDSGEVRGILCAPCNAALGNFRDDPQALRSAIRYLEDSVLRLGHR